MRLMFLLHRADYRIWLVSAGFLNYWNTGAVICIFYYICWQAMASGWQVALNQWLHQNMAAVASMYEDRFDLSILECQHIQSRDDQNVNFGWLKKISFMRSGSISSSQRYVTISSISVPVKRTKELRALVGWYVLLSVTLYLYLSVTASQ